MALSKQQIEVYLDTQLHRALTEVIDALPDDVDPSEVCPSIIKFGMVMLVSQIKFVKKECRGEFLKETFAALEQLYKVEMDANE